MTRTNRQQCSLFLTGLLLLGLSSLSQAQLGGSSLERLSGNERPTPLSLEEAFPYFVSEIGAGEYRVTWTPARGHYLYRHAFAFSLQAGSNNEAQPLAFEIPHGLPKSDQFFGDIEAYYDDVSATISLPATIPEDAKLIIEFQGCADWGFCYPPQRQSFVLQP